MKILKKHIFNVYLFIIILIAGCSTPVSTYTALPTLTITPISTSTFIATPTMVQATPVNTMTFGEQKDFVKGFLSNSGDCLLPCWWNITPGQTWEYAEKNIQSLGSTLVYVFPGYDPETTVYGTPIILNNVIPNASIYIEEKQGLVYAWHILSDWERENPEELSRIWRNYSAQKIIKTYGMPNRILLHGRNTNSLYYGSNYYLWLFYDQLGFSVSYQPLIPNYFSGAPFFRICSETDALLRIEFDMQAPNNPLPLERFDGMFEAIRLGDDIGKGFVVRSLQEATGLSDDEIYEVFMQEKDPCFAIPSDIWNTP